MDFIRKVIKASDLRKSRLHDEKGNFVDFVGFCYAPLAFATALGRIVFDRRPKLPWISYRAIKVIDCLLQKDWKVVEFGSGSSTAWLATRCGQIHSIEDDNQWYAYVSEQLTRENITNVNYELRQKNNYSDLSLHKDGSLDFALIDGWNRADCMRQVIRKIKRGGYIYLDNSDKFANEPDGDIRVAENLLIKAVGERGGTLQYFVDFAPSQFFVSQGVLARL